MNKYSADLKFKIVQEYLEGKGGYLYLAKKHEIKSTKQVRNWVNTYRQFGEEGLFRKRRNEKYSVQFKLNAIELYKTTEMSYREVANILKLNNSALIVGWMTKFRGHGIEGLSNTKGCPPTLSPKIENANIQSTSKVTNETIRIKELEKQVKSLQMENAFLKELRKLRKQEVPKRTKK